jgi:hypothetical protein
VVVVPLAAKMAVMAAAVTVPAAKMMAMPG